MSEFVVDSFDKNTKEFIINSLIKGLSQRKIVEELNDKGISVSDVSIGRWWKENKSKYILDNSRDVFDIDKAAIELADKLDIKKIKTEERTDRLLIQEILRKLMLRYLIDIDRKTKLKQSNIENHYPTDLINSLKTIADLYFKIKESNKHLRDDDDQSIF